MSIEVKFTMERPDASTDFWWETTDPAITAMREKINLLASDRSIQRTSNKSQDGLTYESCFLANDMSAWNQFMDAIIVELPNMLNERNAYLVMAGHSIRMVINNNETNSVIKDTNSPTWSIAI